MSPKVHYPLEQTVLSDNLVIYTYLAPGSVVASKCHETSNLLPSQTGVTTLPHLKEGNRQ